VTRSLFAVVLLFGCWGALGATAPVPEGAKQPNKTKIVGKWKITGGTDLKADDLKMMETLKVFPYIEFKDDGTVTFGVEFGDAEMKKLIEQSGKGDKMNFSFKYKLGSGDEVEFSDVPKELQDKKGGGPFGGKDKAKATVKIDGDKMTMTDEDKKEVKLTRLPKDK
jgi:hypothetical protein